MYIHMYLCMYIYMLRYFSSIFKERICVSRFLFFVIPISKCPSVVYYCVRLIALFHHNFYFRYTQCTATCYRHTQIAVSASIISFDYAQPILFSRIKSQKLFAMLNTILFLRIFEFTLAICPFPLYQRMKCHTHIIYLNHLTFGQPAYCCISAFPWTCNCSSPRL